MKPRKLYIEWTKFGVLCRMAPESERTQSGLLYEIIDQTSDCVTCGGRGRVGAVVREWYHSCIGLPCYDVDDEIPDFPCDDTENPEYRAALYAPPDQPSHTVALCKHCGPHWSDLVCVGPQKPNRELADPCPDCDLGLGRYDEYEPTGKVLKFSLVVKGGGDVVAVSNSQDSLVKAFKSVASAQALNGMEIARSW